MVFEMRASVVLLCLVWGETVRQRPAVLMNAMLDALEMSGLPRQYASPLSLTMPSLLLAISL